MKACIYPLERQVSELTAEHLIAAELPYVNAVYSDGQHLHRDVQEWLSFFIENRHALPLYGLKEQSADEIAAGLSEYYAMMLAALRQVLSLPLEEIRTWFPCKASQDPSFGTFLEYAQHEFFKLNSHNRQHSTVYGRFDAVVEPITGKLQGVYEFNGDTPVMLFESINLQNLIATALHRPNDQYNEWWTRSIENFSAYSGKTVAVACDIGFIEDATTTETIAQLFEAVGAQVYFTTLDGLNHSVLELEQPFVVDEVVSRPDVIFMLLPWEEMWVSGRDILAHWRNWSPNVQFLEPAWRWFLSHKGILAWITHLFQEDEAFRQRWQHLPHLHTEFSADFFIQAGQDYVVKPAIGRLSQNIQIIRQGQTEQVTDGHYGDEVMVYQQYLAPHHVEGRNNFILGAWLAGDQVSTLCFREFDGQVLDLTNERFIAHLLEPLPNS